MYRTCVLAAALVCTAPAALAQPGQPAAVTLTLRQALAMATERSPELAAATATARGEEDAARADGRLTNPTVSWTAEGLRREDAAYEEHIFSASQSLPLGPKLGRARAAGRAAAAVAGAGVAVTRLELARQVVDEYIAVLHAEAQRAIVLATNERLADLVRGLESRVREGISAEGDLRRLEAERARVGFALARLDVQREAANLRLCMWLGLTPCADLQLALPVAPAPRPDPDALAARVEATPGVAEARASVAAARAQQALADVVTRPDLTITSGYKRVQGTPTAVAGLSVTVPLFDRNVADRRRFAARSASAEHVLEAVVRRTRADLEARLALARRLETEASLAQARAVVPAEVSTRAAESAFREGAAELLRVLDAHRTASDVARDVVDLRLDALRASLLLRLELGEEIP